MSTSADKPSTLPKLCAWNIQRWLYMECRSTYAVLLPNYTPRGWHECDIFGVTRAGYFHEFEIKLTVGDYRADAEKRQGDRFDHVPGTSIFNRIPGKKKHDRLGLGDADGPSRFFYIVPADMIANVSSWAGLIYVTPRDEFGQYGRFDTQKKAPKLHEKKVARVILRHAMNVCYYRFWNERREVARLRRAMKDSA